jgi:uncharacterized membrane protein YfcA
MGSRNDTAAAGHSAVPAWHRIIPAMLLIPAWAYVLVSKSLFFDAFSTYYPMAIAMILGSFIAGSTPLGGGVVAFPVAVLTSGFSPTQGRDLAVLIQMCGMSAASYMIVLTKGHLCHWWLIRHCILSGLFGMLMGLNFHFDPFITNMVFTNFVVCFGVLFAYRCYLDVPTADDYLPPARPSEITELAETNIPALLHVAVWVSGGLGGLLTSQTGSGSDMLAYSFGMLVYNSIVPKAQQIPENVLTASSVLIMASMSLMTAVVTEATVGISYDVKLCWAAAFPIVMLGAPLGTMTLTPTMTRALRYVFCVLALTQLICFGVLKMKSNILAWCVVATCLACTTAAIYFYHMKGTQWDRDDSSRNLERKDTVTTSGVIKVCVQTQELQLQL